MKDARGERSRLGELLVELRLVDEATLNAALAEQQRTGRRLPRILADWHIVDEERLAKAVGAKLGLETIPLDNIRIHPRVLARVPADLAARYSMLPYAVKRTPHNEVLFLVMSDPLDNSALAEAQRRSGCQVRVMLSWASAIDRAIEAHYRNVSTELENAQRAPRRSSSLPQALAGADSRGAPMPRSGSSRPASGRALTLSDPESSPPRAASHASAAVEPVPPEREVTVLDGPRWDVGARRPRRLPSGASVPFGGGSEGPDTDPNLLGAGSRYGLIDDAATTVDVQEALTGLVRTTAEPPAETEPMLRLSEDLMPSASEAGPPAFRPEVLPVEVPVDYVEVSHPFEGPQPSDVPVGLGETGISPDVEVDVEPFDPPPLEAFSVEPGAWRGVGASDIPTSPAEVAARGAEVGATDDIADIEEIQLEPLDDADIELAVASESAEASPVSDSDVVSETRSPSLVRAALNEAAAPRPPTPAPVDPSGSRRDAERLISVLEGGGTLNASDRIRLVLALGRALLAQGVLPREALLEELER